MKQVYAIYDMKGKFYGNPFTVLNDDLALRLVDQFLQNPDTDYRRYPEDFVLYHVGTYNDINGSFTSESPRIVQTISSRLDYLRKLFSANIDSSETAGEVNDGTC